MRRHEERQDLVEVASEDDNGSDNCNCSDDNNVDDNEYDDARKGNLVEVEPGKAGADDAAKVGAALLLAETILGTEEECLRVSSDLFSCPSHLQGSSVSGIHRPTTRV